MSRGLRDGAATKDDESMVQDVGQYSIRTVNFCLCDLIVRSAHMAPCVAVDLQGSTLIAVLQNVALLILNACSQAWAGLPQQQKVHS